MYMVYLNNNYDSYNLHYRMFSEYRIDNIVDIIVGYHSALWEH